MVYRDGVIGRSTPSRPKPNSSNSNQINPISPKKQLYSLRSPPCTSPRGIALPIDERPLWMYPATENPPSIIRPRPDQSPCKHLCPNTRAPQPQLQGPPPPPQLEYQPPPEPAQITVESSADEEGGLESPESEKEKEKEEIVTAPKNWARIVVCYSCGRDFTPKALPFHLQACLIKQVANASQLPKHLKPVSVKVPKTQLPSSGGTYQEFHKFNRECEQVYRESLPKCPGCERGMPANRLLVHIKGCLKAKTATQSHSNSSHGMSTPRTSRPSSRQSHSNKSAAQRSRSVPRQATRQHIDRDRPTHDSSPPPSSSSTRGGLGLATPVRGRTRERERTRESVGVSAGRGRAKTPSGSTASAKHNRRSGSTMRSRSRQGREPDSPDSPVGEQPRQRQRGKSPARQALFGLGSEPRRHQTTPHTPARSRTPSRNGGKKGQTQRDLFTTPRRNSVSSVNNGHVTPPRSARVGHSASRATRGRSASVKRPSTATGTRGNTVRTPKNQNQSASRHGMNRSASVSRVSRARSGSVDRTKHNRSASISRISRSRTPNPKRRFSTSFSSSRPTTPRSKKVVSVKSKDSLRMIRGKLQAASYEVGGQDWKRFFKTHDVNKSGGLELPELMQCIRNDCKVC